MWGWGFRALLVALAMLAVPVGAVSFDVRDRLCIAVTDRDLTPVAAATQRYDCHTTAEGYRDRWLWLRVDDPAALAALPGKWSLLVDQARFKEIRAVVTTADGKVRSFSGKAGTLGNNWALGGHLKFALATGTAPVTGIYIGYDGLDHLPIMRKVRLISDDALARQDRNWLLLMGVFLGAAGSSLLYNLFLASGFGVRLRRIYALWATGIIGYGICWTGLVFLFAPGLAGPWGVRVNMWLVAATMALGPLFFSAFIEEEALSPKVRRMIAGSSLATVIAGMIASFDGLAPPGLTDAVWTITVLLGLTAVSAGLIIALNNGSRAARFYALAWTPPIAVILLRVLRNFGVVDQSDLVDYATFGSMAVQAVLLSIALGDRFRLLQIERDRAEQERDDATAEREDMRRLAETDALTGLYNRRGFVQRAQAMVGRHGTLAILDLDDFKSVNDKFGHDVGDAVLVRVARILERAAGEQGVAGRLGGEEFVIIGPLGAAESARAAVESLDLTELLGHGHLVTLSAGVATGASGYESLYVAADRALYRAKQDGRNRVVVAGADATVRAIA